MVWGLGAKHPRLPDWDHYVGFRSALPDLLSDWLGFFILPVSSAAQLASSRDFNSVSIRVEGHALIVPVAGTARPIQDSKTIALESLSQLVDEVL